MPQYRGAAPINWAIINGEKESGVTTFFLKHDIDTGDVLFTEKVTLNGQELLGWKMYQLPFTSLAGFRYLPAQNEGELQPALYRGTFSLRTTGDTYLDMHGYGKGFVFINGHNLGKYWNIGPTQTLYVPAVWLKKGINEVVVFDQLLGDHKEISTLDHPVLNEVMKE